jgi:hypothetical protein
MIVKLFRDFAEYKCLNNFCFSSVGGVFIVVSLDFCDHIRNEVIQLHVLIEIDQESEGILCLFSCCALIVQSF